MKLTALVAGGDTGIGRAIARKLKENGYIVYILGHKEDEDTKEAANEEGVNAVLADLNNIPDSLNTVASLFDTEQGLDVLINAISYIKSEPCKSVTPEIYDDIFNVNFRTPFFICQALLPALEKKKGCIINVSSIITRRAQANFTLYAASKGALESFTRCLAQEAASQGVRVNAISPGAIDTPQLIELLEKENMKNELISTIPLGRMGGPMDIAEVIMAQINSKYVTGSIWSVDGGVSS